MIGVLNINGVIGEIPDESGKIIEPNVSFIDVVRQVESQKEIAQLDVFIKSPGGYLEEGNEIYDYIIGLKAKGLKIKTHAEEVCASVATKIFLAGDERVIHDQPEFMIHNPFGAPKEGDADYIESYYKELRILENDLINFYSKITGTSKEAIKPLMKKETFLTPDQAVELGFATDIYKSIPINALAFSKKFNPKTNKMSETLDKKEAVSLVDKLLKGIKNIGKNEKPKALKTIQDANGTELEFPDLEPDDIPSVGDKTTADDNNYVMPSGETYIVSGGALTEIKPSEGEEEESEEMAEMRQQVENLTEQLATKETSYKALKKENKKLKSQAAKNTDSIKNLEEGLLKVKRSIGSDFKHDGKEKNHKDEGNSRKVWKEKE